MSEELRPCPFCGSMPEVGAANIVKCYDPACGTWQPTRQQWNTRASDKQLASANKGAQTNARVNQLLAERVNLIQAELASAVEVIKHYASETNWECPITHPVEYPDHPQFCSMQQYIPEDESVSHGYDKAAEWLKENGYE